MKICSNCEYVGKYKYDDAMEEYYCKRFKRTKSNYHPEENYRVEERNYCDSWEQLTRKKIVWDTNQYSKVQ